MSADPTNWIRFHRKRAGMTQHELAAKVGSHWVTISKLERGVMRLTQDWMNRLAKALDVEPEELIAGDPGGVTVSGSIDGDGNAQGSSLDLIDLFEDELFVLESTGDFLSPLVQRGDTLGFLWLKERVVASAKGRLCLLLTDVDETSSTWSGLVGLLAQGDSPGTWNLTWPFNPWKRNVRAKRVALLNMAFFQQPFSL